MLRCDNCKITINGRLERCPLCSGTLEGEIEIETIYPKIEKPEFRHYSLVKLITFLSIVVGVVCIAINFMVPSGGLWWSAFVIAGIASFWISFAVALRKRRNILKGIMWQFAIISLIAIGWDWFNTRSGWSVTFVVPILCMCTIIAMIVITRLKHIKIEDYIVYLILDLILGLIPAVFIALDLVTTIIPSAICIAVSLIGLTALGVFRGALAREEMRRRMHM